MRRLCEHISLSPDKWESVILNIVEYHPGNKTVNVDIPFPRVYQVRGKDVNAFYKGNFRKAYVTRCAAGAIAQIYGDDMVKSVTSVIEAEVAIKGAARIIMDRPNTVVNVLTHLFPDLKRAVKLITEDTQDAVVLYNSIITTMTKF